MKTKSAFTLIEIIIVVVNIGLLAAIIIPTVHKIRYNRIKKDVESGKRVTAEEMRIFKQNTPVVKKTIVIDGVTYDLTEVK